MAADQRRVYPEKGSYEDGRCNIMRINDHIYLATAGFFPLAGVVVEGFRQVFKEGRVDLTLLTESEASFRGALTQAYDHLKGEGSSSAEILIGGISTEDAPFLVPVSSSAGFRLQIVREPFATACTNFPEPLQSEVRASLAPLKARLARETFDERRVKAAQAALRQLLVKVAAGSPWVAPVGDMVALSAKGATMSTLKQD